MTSQTATDVDTPRPQGPLSGFTILDLSRVLSGPYCTMILGDLGAEIIKVEQPGTGDDARQFLPFINGESAYFAAVNRGKKSIALDLKSESDREVFEQLLVKADVLVENFRPGVLKKLGYDWEVLKEKHPALILASISGFGQTGPYSSKGVYDLVVQAMSGIMSVTGHPDMPPAKPGTSLGDLAAGIFAANGIQSALLQRFRTGKGCQVDISMLECQIALLENAISRFAATGESPGPIGARHPGSAPFDAFRVHDGYIVITAGADGMFRRFCDVLGHPEWTADPRFIDRKSRVENQEVLKQLAEDVLVTLPGSEWLSKFDAVGIPAGPVNNVEAMMADPQVKSRGILAGINGEEGIVAPCTPVLLSEFGYPASHPPVPRLDQHRGEILHTYGIQSGDD